MNQKMTAAQKELAIKIGAGVFLFFAGWVLAVSPMLDKIRAAKESGVAAGERAQVISDIMTLRRQSKKNMELLVSDSERHVFLGKLTTLSNQNGMEMVSLEPSEDTGEGQGPYTRLIMNLSVRGRFLQFIPFLDEIEKMTPYVAVTDMTIGQISSRRGSSMDNSGSALDARFTFESFLKKDGKT